MNIICLGLNHKSAPLDVRERFAVGDKRLADVAARFCQIEQVEETVILSTCNRVEFYAAGKGLLSGFASLESFLLEHSGLSSPSLDVIYRYDFPRSAHHLFSVVCGLDSMVLGETEILGQVKKAYSEASGQRKTGRVLNKLFQRSFLVAKKARSSTGINRGAISVGSVAADLAGRIFGDLRNCAILLLGAGETGERTARSLLARAACRIKVANRSQQKAELLASDLGGQAVDYVQWVNELTAADILVTSTSAPHPIVRHSAIDKAMRTRPERPLFIIDLAVPRDVETSVNSIENVFLYDIDSLHALAEESMEQRRREIAACQTIITAQVDEFGRWLASLKHPPQAPRARDAHSGWEPTAP